MASDNGTRNTSYIEETTLGTKTNDNLNTSDKCTWRKYVSFPILIIILILIGSMVESYILTVKFSNFESRLTKILNNNNTGRNLELISNETNNLTDKLFDNVIKNHLKIVNRTEWGAAELTDSLERLEWPIQTVIIGQIDTNNCTNFESCKLEMNMLQLFYIQLSYFDDIGYNFLIGGDGVVYEGIGWKLVGNHTNGHNHYSIGIGFIGNYQNENATYKQVDAAKHLLVTGLKNNYLDGNYSIKGQRDLLPIISPGEKLYNEIKTWSHFRV